MTHPSMRILLVEDNPGDARLVREELKEEGGGTFDVSCVESLAAACESICAEHFDAVLLDLNLPDSQGVETFSRLHERAPHLPILLLTGLEDEVLGLRAVQEGAQDFLGKGEIRGNLLARSILYAVERNRSLQWHMSKSRYTAGGKVISFLGAKGGVGTTTLVLNMAGILAGENLVTAAELRGRCGSFSAHLKRSPAENLSRLLELPVDEIREGEIEKLLLKSPFGFHVLFGPQKPEEFRNLTAAHAERIVNQLIRISDYVMLDLPGAYGPECGAALRLSDAIVIVTERDDSSVMAAKMTLDYLRGQGIVSEALGMVIVNRATMVDSLTPDRIESILGTKVLAVLPPAPDLCATAQKSGTPLVLLRPRSAPATLMTRLAQRLSSATRAQAVPA